MPKRQVIVIAHESSGLTFGFWPDSADHNRLHITVRHGTTADDAITTFLSGETLWDAEHKRFETFSSTHGLYWFWWEKDRRVGIITCFRRGDT